MLPSRWSLRKWHVLDVGGAVAAVICLLIFGSEAAALRRLTVTRSASCDNMITVSLPSVSDSLTATRLLLEIPLEKIQSLCLRPAKWLRFVGWSIYHASEGYLSRHSDGSDRLTDDSLLVNGDFIFYHAPGKVEFLL